MYIVMYWRFIIAFSFENLWLAKENCCKCSTDKLTTIIQTGTAEGSKIKSSIQVNNGQLYLTTKYPFPYSLKIETK